MSVWDARGSVRRTHRSVLSFGVNATTLSTTAACPNGSRRTTNVRCANRNGLFSGWEDRRRISSLMFTIFGEQFGGKNSCKYSMTWIRHKYDSMRIFISDLISTLIKIKRVCKSWMIFIAYFHIAGNVGSIQLVCIFRYFNGRGKLWIIYKSISWTTIRTPRI